MNNNVPIKKIVIAIGAIIILIAVVVIFFGKSITQNDKQTFNFDVPAQKVVTIENEIDFPDSDCLGRDVLKSESGECYEIHHSNIINTPDIFLNTYNEYAHPGVDHSLTDSSGKIISVLHGRGLISMPNNTNVLPITTINNRLSSLSLNYISDGYIVSSMLAFEADNIQSVSGNLVQSYPRVVYELTFQVNSQNIIRYFEIDGDIITAINNFNPETLAVGKSGTSKIDGKFVDLTKVIGRTNGYIQSPAEDFFVEVVPQVNADFDQEGEKVSPFNVFNQANEIWFEVDLTEYQKNSGSNMVAWRFCRDGARKTCSAIHSLDYSSPNVDIINYLGIDFKPTLNHITDNLIFASVIIPGVLDASSTDLNYQANLYNQSQELVLGKTGNINSDTRRVNTTFALDARSLTTGTYNLEVCLIPASGGENKCSLTRPVYFSSESNITEAVSLKWWQHFGRIAHAQSTGTTVGSTTLRPSMETAGVDNIGQNTATLYGTVVDQGNGIHALWYSINQDIDTISNGAGTGTNNTVGTGSNGDGTYNFSYNVAGLSPGTTYYYYTCINDTYLYVDCGGIKSFTTLAGDPDLQPVVAALAPTNIGVNTVTVHGNIVEIGNAPASGYFTIQSAHIGAGAHGAAAISNVTSGNTPFQHTFSNLGRGIDYKVRVTANDVDGDGDMEEVFFTTDGGDIDVTPIITTNNPVGITDTRMTLSGNISDLGNGPSQAWFEWGLYNQSTGVAETLNVEDAGFKAFTGPISRTIYGLSPNTTYWMRACIRDIDEETVCGGSITTGGPPVTLDFTPSVITNTASNITSSSATLSGTLVNPGDPPTTAYFQISATDVVNAPALNVAGNVTAGSTFTYAVTGLVPNTTYYFRACATDGDAVNPKTRCGTVRSFNSAALTNALPIVSLLSVTPGPDQIDWEINLSNVGDAPTDLYVQYHTSFLLVTTNYPVLNDQSVPIITTYTASGLDPGTEYYYRVCARDITPDNVCTSIQTVTLPSGPVAGSNSNNITGDTTATISFTAVNLGNNPTSSYFQYATSESAVSSAPQSGLATATSTGTVNFNLTDLTPGTTYYHRGCLVDNSNITSCAGPIASFTMPSSNLLPQATNNSASPEATTATLSFTATDTGDEPATGYFQISTSESGVSNALHLSVAGAVTEGSIVPYITSGLNSGTTYYYHGCLTDSNGDTDCATPIGSFTTDVAPAVTLVADPAQLPITGGDTTLSWISENVESCTLNANPQSIGLPATFENGDEDAGDLIVNVIQTTTFTMECTGDDGNVEAEVEVCIDVLTGDSDCKEFDPPKFEEL